MHFCICCLICKCFTSGYVHEKLLNASLGYTVLKPIIRFQWTPGSTLGLKEQACTSTQSNRLICAGAGMHINALKLYIFVATLSSVLTLLIFPQYHQHKMVPVAVHTTTYGTPGEGYNQPTPQQYPPPSSAYPTGKTPPPPYPT